MKKIAKSLIISLLARQVRRLRQKNDFKVIAVAGSIGKTSTKLAIAEVLSAKFKVRSQDGNYNDVVTVPLVFFELALPSLFNPFAWAWTLARIRLRLLRKYPYDIVVLELGTDGPGQLKAFEKYLKSDLGVLTAITPEHMEFFEDMRAVANEELTLGELSEKLLINADLCAPEYLQSQAGATTYGIDKEAVYRIGDAVLGEHGYQFALQKQGQTILRTQHSSIAQSQLYSLCAAGAVADMLGMNSEEISRGLQNVQAVSGRMQLLKGVNGSIIIDETYNASPEATKLALQTLYDFPASHKIALLGNMNELGGYSAAAHAEIGALCDPKQLDVVVTLGPDANKYLAAAAEKRGCQVKRFSSPYEAGTFIASITQKDSVILAKGSQNGVYAEEAVKQLLQDKHDSDKLVRQSKSWLKKKQAQFRAIKI